VTDRPRLVGWCSLCLSTGPISDVPRHRRGHHLAGSRTGGQLGWDACLATHASPFTRATETAILPSLAERQGDDRNAFRRVTMRQAVSLTFEQRLLPWLGSAAPPAHRSHLETAAGCISTSCGVFLGQHRNPGSPCGSPSLRRAMRRTDFCHLTSSYRYPCLVSFRCVRRLRAGAAGEVVCCTAERLASVGRTIPSVSPRWALSSRRDACDPDL